MPMMVPYGVPPLMHGMAPGPFRVHVAGGHHPGAPQAGPNAGVAPARVLLYAYSLSIICVHQPC